MKALTLKMRAIGLLSQRDHSLIELRRKLLRIARQQRMDREVAKGGGLARGGEAVDRLDPAFEEGIAADADAAVETEVDELLVWLQAQGYLSEARFIESRIHARSQRFGSLRIKQELAQHGLNLSAENVAELKSSEFERAQAIWQRKFGGLAPGDPAARAKQTRFLIARGFASEVIRRVLKAEAD